MDQMKQSWHVKDYGDLHQDTLEGREFVMRVKLSDGRDHERKYRRLVAALRDAIWYRRKAFWAEVVDYTENIVVSRQTMARLWAADAGCFGAMTAQAPFIVLGPTINPQYIERYWAAQIIDAVDFATGWLNNAWNEPYWVAIQGPNGCRVLGPTVLQRMYHTELKSRGETLVEQVVRPSDGPGLFKVLSTRQIV